MSWKQPDGTFLVDARGISWDLLTAADVVTTSADGSIVDGRWGVTPALAMHWAIHRRRPDIGVVVHQHSRYGTVWAAMNRLPPVFDQTSALLEGGLALHETYDGSVGEVDAAERAADALGEAGCALLGQHGVLVTGRDPSHVFQRAVLLEWRCRLAWHVQAAGGAPRELPAAIVAELAALYEGRDYPELFAAMAHRIIDEHPDLWKGR
jgi:ribulose-5-phosphate 4-epimerase/fuculose-1-phosphate aldolase